MLVRTPPTRTWWATQVVLGYVLATGLMLGGLWLWDRAWAVARTAAQVRLDRAAAYGGCRSAAMGLGGIALLVFMVFVADELCPQADRLFTWFAKVFVATLSIGAMLKLLWHAAQVLGMV